MGLFMQEHDIYIGSVLDELNLRFAPTTGKGSEHNGGIQEMAALQKEFELFKKGRPFKTSLTALHLFAKNTAVKNRWYTLVGNLRKHKSNWLGLDGDSAIVDAITKNLAAKNPLPIYFASHDMRGDKSNAEVKITPKGRPLHYLEKDYLVISIPMQSVQAAQAAMKSKAAAKKPAAKKAPAAKK
jgi:hypothetical protein